VHLLFCFSWFLPRELYRCTRVPYVTHPSLQHIRIIAAIPDTLTLNQADYKDTTIIKLKKRQVHKILSKFM